MPDIQRDARTGVMIDRERDLLTGDFAATLLRDFYTKPGETPQEAFARAAKAWSDGDNGLAQRIYDAASKGWFMFASPVLSNAPLPGEKIKGLPISCFLNHVDDTLESLIEHSTETRWLAVMGGGVGGHWSSVRSVSDKAPGPIPFIRTLDADMEAYKQGRVRRGSYAAYLDVSHPDIVEFLHLREPTGDTSRKCLGAGFHHGVNITDDFMAAVDAGADWPLIDPHDKSVRDSIKARDLWQAILEMRYKTGEPYLHFIDTANRALPQPLKDLGLRINGSNLCAEIELPTAPGRTAVCCLSSLNAATYDEWKDTTLVGDLIEMLDNVLSHFIETAPPQLAAAVYSAKQERSLGLGLMGFHSYLMDKGVPFESEAARQINLEMFGRIREQADAASLALGALKGEAPDMLGTGRRTSHNMAVAPNANSSILLNVTPATEAMPANAYVHRTRAGSWQVKNPALERLLAAKGKNTEAVWKDIVTSKGSVQHLDFLSDAEKAVFKTAIEMNQDWVVIHAADRAPLIDQGQSVNLFFPPGADRSYIHRVHRMAHRLGVKSLYYLRTQASNRAEDVSKKVVRQALADAEKPEATPEDCLACQG